jgi:hypothetical protein
MNSRDSGRDCLGAEESSGRSQGEPGPAAIGSSRTAVIGFGVGMAQERE